MCYDVASRDHVQHVSHWAMFPVDRAEHGQHAFEEFKFELAIASEKDPQQSLSFKGAKISPLKVSGRCSVRRGT